MPDIVECSVEIMDSGDRLDVTTFTRLCHIEPQFLIELVEAGVLEPEGESFGEWQFPGSDLSRGRIAARLRHDLGLDPPALGLVLDLLEERARLERQIAVLRGIIEP
jgi:chaperone modulatory protein CbpM